MNFEVGDRVTWTSQSQGTARTKTGEVISVIEPKVDPKHEVFDLVQTGRHRGAYGGGWPRNHRSYLVLVPCPNGGRPVIYWPRVSKLRTA